MSKGKGKVIGAVITAGIFGIGGVAGGITLANHMNVEKVAEAEDKGYKEGYQDGIEVNVGYTEEEMEQAKEQAKEEGKQEGYENGFDDGLKYKPSYETANTTAKFNEAFEKYDINNDILIYFKTSKVISLFKDNNFGKEIELFDNVSAFYNVISTGNKYCISYKDTKNILQIVSIDFLGNILNKNSLETNFITYLININNSSEIMAYSIASDIKKVINLYKVNEDMSLTMIILPDGMNIKNIRLKNIDYTEFGYFFTGESSCYYVNLDFSKVVEFKLPSGSIFSSHYFNLGDKVFLGLKTSSSDTGAYYTIIDNSENIDNIEIKKIVFNCFDGSIAKENYFNDITQVEIIDEYSLIFYGNLSPLYYDGISDTFVYNKTAFYSKSEIVFRNNKFLIFNGTNKGEGWDFLVFDKLEKKFLWGKDFYNKAMGTFESVVAIEGGYKFTLSNSIVFYKNETVSSLIYQYKIDDKYYVLKNSTLSLYESYIVENNEFVKEDVVILKEKPIL